MKSVILAVFASVALVSTAQADVIRDLASTSSTITTHGVFDGH